LPGEYGKCASSGVAKVCRRRRLLRCRAQRSASGWPPRSLGRNLAADNRVRAGGSERALAPRERFRKAPTIRAVGRLSALARTTECLEHYRRRLRGSGGAQLSRKEQANARGYTRFRARIGRPCQDDGAGEIVRCFATPPASNVLSTLIRRYCPIREQRSNSLPQGTYAAVLRNAARCSNRSRTTSNGWRLSIQGEKALRNLERS
jgi:hypothetical protein